MECLSGLRPLGPRVAAKKYLQDAGPSDYRASALWRNFVRLVDYAIREYELARQLIEGFSREPASKGLNAPICASGHFETVLTTIVRASKHAGGLEKLLASSQSDADLRLQDEVGQLSVDTDGRIRSMRNAIHHLDERILKGKIPADQNCVLRPGEKGLELGKHSISYDDICCTLKQLYRTAKVLAR